MQAARPWLRPDTIAALASAVAATASAIAAIYALVYLARQEKATYESNLQSKQVEGLAPLQAALVEFIALVEADKVGDRSYRPADVQKYQNQLRDRFSRYYNKQYEIAARTEAVALLVPELMINTIYMPHTSSNKIIGAMRKFIDTQLGPTSLDEFAETAAQGRDEFGSWQGIFINCIRPILATGKPITEENSRSCGDQPSR